MASNSRKRMAFDDLPNDCWELVASKLVEDKEGKHDLETLSLLSKELLSITNRVMHSFKLINNPLIDIPYFPRIFNRFPNLTSLDFSAYRGSADELNALICRIPPCSFSQLTSLNFSNNHIIPTLGLQFILLQNSSNSLTSLICSNIASIKSTNIIFIAYSFPLLQHLDFSFPAGGRVGGISHPVEDYNNALYLLSQKLSKLRSVDFSSNFYINDSSFLQLCINCEYLQDVLVPNCPYITNNGIAEAIHYRPTLNSFFVTHSKEAGQANFIVSLTCLKRLTCLDLSFSCINDLLLKSIALEGLPLTKLVLQGCYNYTYDGISFLLSKCLSLQHLDLQRANFLDDRNLNKLCAFLAGLVSINVSGCGKLSNSSFLALLSNCPLLAEIRMESTNIGFGPSLLHLAVVYPKVKSLHLASNTNLQNHDIYNFGSMFPNMQYIDLSFCNHISARSTFILLHKCHQMRHLKFSGFPQAKHFWIFGVCSLEVLTLSHSRINDKNLYDISTICPRLLQLNLDHCYVVTEKGVQQAVENCTRLREINLQCCVNVSTDIVSWMILSRPSLRKITTQPHFRLRDYKKLLSGRCHVVFQLFCKFCNRA